MKRVKKKAAACSKKRPTNFPGGVRYVMDNAPYHIDWINQNESRLLRLPPLSPEFNKPVEHMFNCIKREFKKMYAKLMIERCRGGKLYIKFKEGAVATFAAAVKAVVHKEGIAKDAASMKATFRAVINAKGDYIPKKYS